MLLFLKSVFKGPHQAGLLGGPSRLVFRGGFTPVLPRTPGARFGARNSISIWDGFSGDFVICGERDVVSTKIKMMLTWLSLVVCVLYPAVRFGCLEEEVLAFWFLMLLCKHTHTHAHTITHTHTHTHTQTHPPCF